MRSTHFRSACWFTLLPSSVAPIAQPDTPGRENPPNTMLVAEPHFHCLSVL